MIKRSQGLEIVEIQGVRHRIWHAIEVAHAGKRQPFEGSEALAAGQFDRIQTGELFKVRQFRDVFDPTHVQRAQSRGFTEGFQRAQGRAIADVQNFQPSGTGFEAVN